MFWSDTATGTITGRPLDTPQFVTTTLPLGKSPIALAASNDRLVVLASSLLVGGEVQQYSFGLSAALVVSGLASPFDVAVAGTAIYWTESSSGRIGRGTIDVANSTRCRRRRDGLRVNRRQRRGGLLDAAERWSRAHAVATGSVTGMSLAEKETSPSSIAADDTDVYWLTGDGKLRRKTIGQELPPATLASGFKAAFAGTHVRAIALTSKYVVWLTTDGRVLRIAK